MTPNVTIKQLLEAGVHFGHQTKRWNPKMKPYIFGERNGIYIIDLQKTLRLFKAALDFVAGLAAQGKIILFVGTKRQAQEAIAEEAQRCNMYYVNQRWLGGLLTNFSTIQRSIQRLKELETMKETGQYNLLSKKEVARLERERKKLDKYLVGIKEMPRLPDAIFVIDAMKEAIAIREAKRLAIPVVSIVDTNCDPEMVDYVIPGNDDALKSVRLITSSIAQAVLVGRQLAMAAAETEEERAALEGPTPAEGVPATGPALPATPPGARPSDRPRPERAAGAEATRPRSDQGRRPDRRGRPQAPPRPGAPGPRRGEPPKGRPQEAAGGPAQPGAAPRAGQRRPERGPRPEAPRKATGTSTPATPVPAPSPLPAEPVAPSPAAAPEASTAPMTTAETPVQATIAPEMAPQAPAPAPISQAPETPPQPAHEATAPAAAPEAPAPAPEASAPAESSASPEPPADPDHPAS